VAALKKPRINNLVHPPGGWVRLLPMASTTSLEPTRKMGILSLTFDSQRHCTPVQIAPIVPIGGRGLVGDFPFPRTAESFPV
jgi:hypothetical protein